MTATGILEQAERHLHEYANRGILLDASPLFVYVLGLAELSRVGKTRHTKQYSADDFEWIRAFTQRFSTTVTTSHVLTEVSNLLSSDLSGELLIRARIVLCKLVEAIEEVRPGSLSLCADQTTLRVGLPDASVLAATAGKYLLLTADAMLTAEVQRAGGAVLNYNWIREVLLST